jgi:polyphosphate kinase 2 (PPK2 family)
VAAEVIGVIDDKERTRRYEHINAFEKMLLDEGTSIVKIFLHVGKEEQRRRLQARLDDPEKRWKFEKADLDTRAQWDRYMTLYDTAITATSTRWAPWYVVPADHKWYTRLIVASAIIDTLGRLDLHFPDADAEVKKELQKVRAGLLAEE